MSSLLDIPEIRGLDGWSDLIRIPNQIDVPVTPRIKNLIDTPEFQRLKKISQLGMVSFVYPAATHSRFEHSLGVYRNSLLFLRQFAEQPEFNLLVSKRDAEILILASLLHDVGHWPYCHPIEDIELEGIPSHEVFATRYLERDSISQKIQEQWGIEASEVLSVINRKRETPVQAILSSILSGPIDIDKMDYLYRDSLHAGVPYGQNFDSLRLIRSLCLNKNSDRLAITEKGRTPAELMVFARYVMFSEVYWHHTVRSATTMFQRAFYRWYEANRHEGDFESLVSQLFESGETEMIQQMGLDLKSESASGMLEHLFGANRRLHKRAANFSFNENASTFEKVAYHPYPWLVATSERLTKLISEEVGASIPPDAILIDAPPVGLEVQFNVDVYSPKSNTYRPLGEVSPVVNTLAKRQFDDFVKQVRVFVEPSLLPLVEQLDLERLLVVASEN